MFQDYVQVYQQNAIEEYHSQSILNELAIISTGTSRKRGQKLTGRNIIKRIDKTEFTLINIAKPEELVNRVGYEAIGQIVNAETNFVIQKWLSRKGKTYITVKNLTYKVIAEATKEIHKTGHEATVIIVPWQQYAKAWREDPDIRRFTKHEGNDRFIKIGGISYLRVIENDGDDVVILDKSASDWTYIQPPSVEIIEDRSNPLYVQIQAEEIVDFQIKKPTGARIIKIINSPEEDTSLL